MSKYLVTTTEIKNAAIHHNRKGYSDDVTLSKSEIASLVESYDGTDMPRDAFADVVATAIRYKNIERHPYFSAPAWGMSLCDEEATEEQDENEMFLYAPVMKYDDGLFLCINNF